MEAMVIGQSYETPIFTNYYYSQNTSRLKNALLFFRYLLHIFVRQYGHGMEEVEPFQLRLNLSQRLLYLYHASLTTTGVATS